MMRVGLTGGIGSGKSSVSRLLAERGAVVVDADLLARDVVAAGTTGLAEIVVEFGPDMLTESGELDRTAMGERVFGDDRARARLEQIIHPRVRARAAEIESASPPDAIVVHDIPLLVETGQADRFDAVIVVDAPVDVQLQRLTGTRGMGEEEARSRISAQTTRERRLAVADHVIENAGTLDDLRAAVDAVWAQLTDRVSASGDEAGRF
ncbi:MAG: dephospho-CoA kinase [Nocardioidaceae bacterium]|nr:dephospho-CoA kinase [Nocardioidaceae bacterium]